MTAKEKLMFWLDTLERVATTFVEGFLVAWVTIDTVTGNGLTFDSLFSTTSLKGGVVGGVLALVKAFVANKLPHTADSSASFLPERLDPPAEDGSADWSLVSSIVVAVLIVWLLIQLLNMAF